MTRGEIRATLVVVVLVVVGVIALWPRGTSTPSGGPPPTPSSTSSTTTGDPARLAAARQDAALAPCPPATGAAPVAPLAGLTLDCLGTPGSVDLGTALGGRTTLVNLWASWCGPCREEIPALAAYAAGPDAVGVLGVDVADEPASGLALMASLGARYPSVSDPEQTVGARVGAPPVLPATVVVRADGRVVEVPPQVLRTPEQVRDAVAQALAR